MQEIIQPQARGRSNSLQRMLDLEKKLNFQRTHQGSVPPSPTVTDSSVPPSPGFAPRRFELVPKDKKVPPPVRNYNAVPPPLFSSHTAPARVESPNMIQRKPVGQGASRSVSREASTTDLTADKHPQKTVAFMFPPDVEEQRSVCQSPTWEAYDRRKKEKKEEKRKESEKKKEDDKKKEQEKDQAMNEALEEAWKNAPKPRGRKLTKHQPPPTSGVFAAQGRSMTEPGRPPTTQQKRRSRSSSLLGFSIGRNNDEPEEPRSHRRSNSLTSLFRSSFEIRRASFDETSSTGFLGGVKLEKKKEDFHQKVLEDQAKGNSKVHPALRKSFLGHGSFTPLKTNPQQTKEADAQRRAYPPISINTAAAARGHSMKPPKSPQRRGSVNIYLWSARAKRNSAASECAVADDTEDEEEQIRVHTPDSEVLYNKAQGLTRRGCVHIKNGSNPVSDQKSVKSHEDLKARAQSESSQARPVSAESTQSQRMREIPPLRIKTPKVTEKPAPEETAASKPPIVPLAKPRPRRASVTSTSTAPEPPRKSSKRNSLIFLTRLQSHSPQDDPSSSRGSFGSPKDKKSMESSRSSKSSKHNPPSIRYEHTSAGERPKPITAESSPVVNTKWTLREAAKSAFSRGHSSNGSISRPSTANVSPEPSTNSPNTDSSTPFMSHSQPYRGLNISGGVPLDATHSARPGNKHLSPAMSSPTCRPMTSSSDSSYSDAVQSVSPLSTPHTTPPQSEMGHSPRMATIKPVLPPPANHGYEQVSPYWSYTNSPQLLPTEPSDLSSSEAEADPIQEAANRVMEAFSNANLRSPTFQRKRSDLNSSAETSFASTPTQLHPPLKHKDRSKARIRSPVNPQSPRFDRVGSPLRGHRPTLSDPEASIKMLRHRANLEHQQPGDPVAKMFVECCECKYYHDMPSKLYEAMSNPDAVLSSTEQLGFAGSVSMTVRCPWCKHEMSTKCCAGFAAMVYIKERFH
ncbi:hypothetical protein BHE90_000581 [Fusarium euwallaceae]|uniref:Uncharacterized protein n=1 Tax=Fusarium euwallaceae TaxID=1147111 RepID=A0A430MA44_9HYPO|nr:hypothetical protein BHE90_000581 [Fusarium euwallaceae]